MKTHRTIKTIIPIIGALVAGYLTLAFSVWLYPSVIAPHSKAVPLQGVTIQGFHLDRSGMFWCLVIFGIATLILLGFSVYMICARRRDA